MKLSFRRLLLIVGVGALVIVVLTLRNPRERESRQRVEFLTIAKRINRQIDFSPDGIPSGLGEFFSKGVLSKDEWDFARKHRILYIRPTNGSSDQIILTMRANGGVEYRFGRDGYMLTTRMTNR